MACSPRRGAETAMACSPLTPTGLCPGLYLGFTCAEGWRATLATDNREENEMPRILIVTDAGDAAEVVYSERLVPAHLQTEHAGRLLVERLAWAVEDAGRAERKRLETRTAPRRVVKEIPQKEQAWIPT